MAESEVAYADTLDQAATDLFEDQGYVVIRGVLDDEQDVQPVKDEYAALLDALAAKWREDGALSSTYDDLPFEQRLAKIAAEGVQYTRHLDIAVSKGGLMHQGPAVFNLLRSPRLLDGAEHFIGPELYSNPVQHLRIKVPERLVPEDNHNALNSRAPWHQDMAVVLPEADDTEMLTVWVAISEATEENGCLVVVPESHRDDEVALHCKTGGSIPEEVVGAERLPLVMESGDVLFMSKRTMHASLANVSDGVRFSFDLRYNPVGQPTGRPWFPGFVARSRSNPASEVRDFEEWVRIWDEAHRALEAVDYETPDNPHFLTPEQDPRCA